MRTYKIKIVPIEEDEGLDYMQLDIRANSRKEAQTLSLNQPFTKGKFRLHDSERSKS